MHGEIVERKAEKLLMHGEIVEPLELGFEIHAAATHTQ